jgi:hypothetical protein
LRGFLLVQCLDRELSPQAYSQLKAIGNADVLVGIPAFNNLSTTNCSLSPVTDGLTTFFPDLKAAFFLGVPNSADGASIQTTQLPQGQGVLPAVYLGASGKGSAVKAILEAAQLLGVKAVVLVDSDLRGITPQWINLMLSPVLSDSGFVAPFYARRKYASALNDFLAYPLTYSLYGKEIRQPLGGDFGLSAALVNELLESPLWQTEQIRGFGVDIFETHTALAEGVLVKQAFLGVREHDSQAAVADLAPLFRQVAGSLFVCINHYRDAWESLGVGGCEVEIVGEQKHPDNLSASPIDLNATLSNFKVDFDANRQLTRTIIGERLTREFENLKALDKTEASLSTETWAKTVYSFVSAYAKADLGRKGQVLEALRVLWVGRVASFVKETWRLSARETERRGRDEADVLLKYRDTLNLT